MSAQDNLPFYPLNLDGEPLYCVCDHGGPETDDWCKKCPFRSEHHASAVFELCERIAKAKATGATS